MADRGLGKLQEISDSEIRYANRLWCWLLCLFNFKVIS